MDTAEVITVNSSPPLTVSSTIDSKDNMLSCNGKDDIGALKAESCNTERVPVSWAGVKHNIQSVTTNPHSPNSVTPSPKTKVTNWLNPKKTNSNWSQVSVVTAPPRFVTEYKSAILARHDFKKSYSISDCNNSQGGKPAKFTPCSSATPPKSSEIFERHNVFHIKTNCSDLPKHGMFEIENAVPSPSRTTINLISNGPSRDYNIFVKNSVKTETECEKIGNPEERITVVRRPKNSNTPLSPESVKKKELCTYLQLVNLNVASRKEIAPIQNRRSVRVKNNLLLTEKKQLERKLNGDECGASTSENNAVENASKLSFEELFGENNVLAKKSHESEPKPKTEDVTVGYIPKELLEKREDFDDCATEFFNRENLQIPQQKKPRKLLLKGKWTAQTASAEALKKRKLREQFKRIFKTPVKRNGAYSLKKKRYKNKKSDKAQTQKYKSGENGVKRLLKSVVVGKKDQSKTKKSKTPLRRNKFVLQSSRMKRKTKKCDEESGDVAADVVMQDHDYICGDESVEIDEKLRNGEADCCGKSTSSLSPCHGFNSPDMSQMPCFEVNKLYLELNEFLQSEQFAITDLEMDVESTLNVNVNPTAVKQEEEDAKEAVNPKVDVVDSNLIPAKTCDYVALDPEIKPKSLHQTLGTQRVRRRRFYLTDGETDDSAGCDNTDESPSTSKHTKNDKRSTLSHSICTSKSAGTVVNAFYRNFNLIVAQEFEVTFWSQSALGNVLGAHNMWLQKGQVSRLVLDSGCVQKDSNEMVISLESSVAYVELWTKEHKSDKREIPVADVFAALYFCKLRQNGVFKKVLQLENIKSSAEDVRYIVMQNSRNIIVSWRMVRGEEKITVVHCYHLAADYQTVEVTKELKSVEHYVSSLHNIEGSDDLIVGWGENMVTLWNVEFGYIIATVQIVETMPLSSPLHIKCDRGFLFLLQQLENKNLCLIAINGLNQSWKRLQTFVPPQNFEKITGVYLDDGLLVAFYRNGVLAWHINSGELRVEEEGLNCDMWIQSGKHAIMFAKDRVYVRHALTLLIASDDFVGAVEEH